MFKSVSPKLDVPSMEENVLKFWQDNNIFHELNKQTEGRPEYVFFEGPPTANGRPGVHHVLARAFKDMFPRYKIMNGYHVIRRGGWDTHGLPVEIEVEKKLGFTQKGEIDEYGIAKFNELCRESAFAYIKDWEQLTDRIGFWVDLEKAYITYKNEYIESVWWILKNFWDRDLLYQGYKVVPYCPRCGTPLSDHEVALGYKETEDPSIFVRMRLIDEPDTSLLVWTTTPWTLPANVVVAANEVENYVKVEITGNIGKEKLILAEPLLEKVFGDQEYKVLDTFKGAELEGKQYQPLFDFIKPDKPAHYVVLADFVTMEDGSGLVHTAPAFGAEDMELANKLDLPAIMTVNPDGTFMDEIEPWKGVFVKDADPSIIEYLTEKGLMFKADIYSHTYPFCWRCKSPLLYYARPTWYIRTSQFKDRLVEINRNNVNWFPEHIKEGRFGNWLENNVDWALGRERYWGTPLPVWVCQDCEHQECAGSVEDLEKLSGKKLEGLDLHRPHVDEIDGVCPKCGGVMKRVPELIDVWFDSGAMQVAQWHFPFENKETFENQSPADFICEAVDQTRGWFYSLHAISTLLFDRESYKNCMCLGLILDGEGQKMSKSRGNVVDPWEVINANGADAMRWYLYTASPPGQERRFSSELVGEVVRSFTLTLWNTYSFFVTYANLDNWKPGEGTVEYSDLDQWLRSSLHALTRDITNALENYDVLGATRPIQSFVDQLSNWYLRLSRRRFWKSESDGDKNAAYATLYEALVTISKLLAPTMPFVAEELYQNLVRTVDTDVPVSIHMDTWPEFDESLIDEKLNSEMQLVMRLVSLGHAARNKANRKVRQPLSEAAFAAGSASELNVLEKYEDLFKSELNVKSVRPLAAASEAVAYSLNPLPKQLGQKYASKFPVIRKAILALDAEKAAHSLMDGKSVKVEADGETFDILPEEVEVRLQAKSGFAVSSEGAYLAALVTDLTPDLVREGLAREVVRKVQDQRKQNGFEISDRIEITASGSDMILQALKDHSDYIKEETLSVAIHVVDDTSLDRFEIDEEWIALKLDKVQ